MNTDPWSWIAIIFLIVVGSFFSGTETALMSCNEHRHFLKVKAENGNRRARWTLKVLDNYDTTIITLLIGNNIFNVATGVLTTVVMSQLFDATMGLILATILSTVSVLLFGELLPKTVAKAHPNTWSMNASFIIMGLHFLFYPLVLFFRGLTLILRAIFKDSNDDLQFTDDDFQIVVDTIEEEGIIDSEEAEIFQAAVEFCETFAKDVLTKRHEMIGIELGSCNHEFLRKFILEHEYSRFPIFDKNIDHIVGVLHVRTYLKAYFADPSIEVVDYLTPPYYITSKMTLMEVFEGFQKNRTHMAIVKSVKDKTLGMVTMKDVLEELISDIDEAGTSPDEGGALDD